MTNMQNKLLNLANALSNSDKEINRLAMLAKAYLTANEFVISKSIPSNDKLLKVKDSFAAAAEVDRRDKTIPETLLRFAKEFKRREFTDKAQEILRIIRNIYKNTEDPEMRDIVSRIDAKIFSNQFGVSPLTPLQKRKRLADSNKLVEASKQMVNMGLATPIGGGGLQNDYYLKMAILLTSTMDIGDFKAVDGLVRSAKPIFDREDSSPKLKIAFENIASVNEIFVESDIVLASDFIAEHRLQDWCDDAKQILIVFVRSNPLLGIQSNSPDFGKRYLQLVASNKLKILVVLLDDGKSNATWKSLAGEINKTPGRKLQKMDVTEAKPALLELTSLGTETSLLIDGDRQIQHIQFTSNSKLLDAAIFELVR